MPNDLTPPTEGRAARSSLFWRLLPSYLLVVAVGAITTFLAGETFAGFFLERHMGGMMGPMNDLGGGNMMEGMRTDLDAAYSRAITSSLAWAAAVSVLTAAMVGTFVTGRIVTPLRALTRASSRIAGGTYQDRLDANAPGEIGELAEAFNTMAATLERSEERRVTLLSDVAHEFRTPLSNLKGYLEGLEDGVFELDTRTLASCGQQLQRLERLVDDLSLLSRVETGQLDLRPRPVTVAELFDEAVGAFRVRFEAKGVHLEREGADAVPAVHADPERIAQVLSNLLANALRHTAPGGHVTLRARATGPEEVLFEVEDDGPGVPPEVRSHVFERFYRGDRSRRRDDESGSGIGLTLVKQLVERQGGQVGVQSNAGAGARFWFTLPANEGPRVDAARA